MSDVSKLRKHLKTWAATGAEEGREALATFEQLAVICPPTESEQVGEFMRKFGQQFKRGTGADLPHRPRHLTLRKAMERHDFMAEELGEFYDAAHANDLPLMADALVDLVYVAKGTANLLGLETTWPELWADVQRANMAKERGITHRGNKVDCVKPSGWVPPHTKAILEANGYRPGFDDHALWDDPEHSPGGLQVGDELNEARIAGSGMDNGGKP
jgi:predicted HAD superfamily Cof-like phosphohydrolase